MVKASYLGTNSKRIIKNISLALSKFIESKGSLDKIKLLI